MQKELEQFIETEQAQARVQTQIHNLTSLCWDKCVFSPLLLALSRFPFPPPAPRLDASARSRRASLERSRAASPTASTAFSTRTTSSPARRSRSTPKAARNEPRVWPAVALAPRPASYADTIRFAGLLPGSALQGRCPGVDPHLGAISDVHTHACRNAFAHIIRPCATKYIT